MKPILSLENVSKYYVSQSSVVMGLNNARLNFQRGEFVAITGESGSGKTTLSKVIAGILGYESGEMRFDGKPTSHYDSGDWERFQYQLYIPGLRPFARLQRVGKCDHGVAPGGCGASCR